MINEIYTTKVFVASGQVPLSAIPIASNRICYDYSTKTLNIYNKAKSSWQQLTSDAIIYATDLTALQAVTGEFNGQIGIDAAELDLYIWIDSAWVQAGGSGSITLVANSAALPTDADEGDVAITQDNNVLYFYSGSAWVSTAELITLSDKTSVTVGGINSNTTIENKTNKELWEMLLLKELNPSLTDPSTSFSFNAGSSGVLKEIGSTIAPLTFTATFNRGSINPQYQSESPYRSGLPNKYTYTGAEIAGDVASTALSNSQQIDSYTVVSGGQSWTMTCSYDAGVQPKTNKGNNYSSAKAAGTIAAKTLTINGVYPWFATTASITTLTKQTLAQSTNSYYQVKVVAETDTDKQTIQFPANFKEIKGIAVLNTLSNKYEWIDGSAAASLNAFAKTTTVKEINGNQVNYVQYQRSGAKTGEVTLRFVTSTTLPA